MVLSQISHILEQLVAIYGLPGLFIASFLGSTVFVPFPTEVVFPLLRAFGVSSLAILLVASAASVAGLYVNYQVGYRSVKYLGKKIKKKRGQKAKKIIQEYGDVGLFIIIVFPVFPADPLTTIAGMAEMDIQRFLIISALAKLIRYGTVLGVVNLFV
ncbi:YqaA family protein [Candidatus Altiarchaeota archaeon]